MNKEKKWATKLGKLPGVAAIFLSGSRAQDRGTDESDIDFFIIARPGQIWTARFFVLVTLKLHNQLAKPILGDDTIVPRAENIPPLGKFLELILKHSQIWITKRNPEYKTPDAKIVLNDHELRFHPHPRNKDWSK